MLRYNEARSQRAHVLHAVTAGLHVVCCGVPVLAQLIGLGVIASSAALAHAWIHGYEWLVLIFSGVLLALGVAMEWRASRAVFRPSWLLYVSGFCFAANALMFGLHGLPA